MGCLMTINGCIWPCTPGSALDSAGDSGPAGHRTAGADLGLEPAPLSYLVAESGAGTCGARKRLRVSPWWAQTQVGPWAWPELGAQGLSM